ncbi:phosphoribosyltransferase-like protein [Polaribacter vadi]|uniref:phosphoribosyltransferase-like protein n=1 Tax=Polaribacter vadi TaxID=1774273 RepID=UPI0030EE3C2A|tara:strand:+ start:20077 stop:20967 length:891 start_codon:yes stop_codon:yes gene_type:complete
MIKKQIEPAELIQIDQLFQDKNWEIEEDIDIRISLYQKFIDRYERIKKEDRELFIKLSKKFLRITEKEVYSIFRDSYNQIDEDYLKPAENIFILPLVEPYIKLKKTATEKISRPKIKSGEKIKLFIEINEYRELKFSEKISLPDNFAMIEKSFKPKKDLLILVDDFIGSGRTANEILKSIFDNKKFDPDNVIILSLVAQEIGINSIYETNKVFTFYKYLKKKAISDFYEGDKLKENIAKSISMEETMNIPEQWSLGYEKSEALVSIMNKSPNNTFPIFWYETKKMIAPFKRYVNFK